MKTMRSVSRLAREPTNRTTAKLLVEAVGASFVCMLIVGSFVGALHRPSPHALPVGVVGPAAVSKQLSSGVAGHAPGAFHVTRYDSEGSARQAVLDRKVDGALVFGATGERLLLAGASGISTKDAVTTAFEGVASSTGQHLVVEDLRPLPAGDPAGVSQLLLFIGLALPSLTFGIAVGTASRRERNPRASLGVLGFYAVLAGLIGTLVADSIVGALAGAPFGLFGIAVLTAFAISTSCAAAASLMGPAFGGLMALLIVPVGIPAAGGPDGVNFISSWYGDLGSALPAGAMMPAVRDIVYFNAHSVGTPLLVLSLWAGVAAVACLLAPLRHATSTRAITN